MAESESIDVEVDGVNTQNYSIQTWTNRFSQKVTVERIILVTNTIIELPSAVFDQLSSVHQPKYAFISMLMSFTVFLLSIIDLVYKGRRESVRFKIKGLIPWFYHPYPDSKPFGRFPDIIGLICAFSQCIFASIAYACLNRHANNPVNLNVWPLVFALGLLCSRFSDNASERRLTHVMRRKRYRDVFVADVISSERHNMAESLEIDVEHETKSSEKANSTTDSFSQKVTSLETMFLITNFLLELPSAVFDQLSSVHKPQFALLSMLMSFTVLFISVIDLVYKGRQERVYLMKKGLVPWFYYPYPSSKPFGKFPDIIGLVCALFQWIFASIGYVFVSRNTDNPVKVSTWPIFFAFGLLYAKISGNFLRRRPTSNPRKLHRAEEFTLAELAAATNDFSANNKVGAGRFCIIYKGRLLDGREVAIKRRDVSEQNKIEEDDAFESELTHLSRLHHKHLVGLVGYCEYGTERLLVFDYMINDLYYLLFLKDSSMINSWIMRIGIALDAARGIDYLHNYAVPPIIHRAIKSYCILLDANWTARISDFDLAMMGLESEQESKSKTTAGSDGYVDPEYVNGGNILTGKSDVYSFGVVLLELLTGKPAIFISGGKPKKLVEFAVPKILGNELRLILDRRVGSPESANVAEAIEMVASTALHCVNSDGISRPTITSVVNNLERALSLLSDGTRTIK